MKHLQESNTWMRLELETRVREHRVGNRVYGEVRVVKRELARLVGRTVHVTISDSPCRTNNNIDKILEELNRKITEKPDYFPRIITIAEAFGADPATILLMFISKCIENADCAVQLSMIEYRYTDIILDVIKTDKKLEKAIELVNSILEQKYLDQIEEKKREEEEAYMRLKRLLSEEGEETR